MNWKNDDFWMDVSKVWEMIDRHVRILKGSCRLFTPYPFNDYNVRDCFKSFCWYNINFYQTQLIVPFSWKLSCLAIIVVRFKKHKSFLSKQPPSATSTRMDQLNWIMFAFLPPQEKDAVCFNFFSGWWFQPS